MSILIKIKSILNKIRCVLSSNYAQKYYTQKYHQEIKLCHSSVVFKGKVFISDPRNVIIGKNVVINKGSSFISNGGIYIGDNVIIEKSVTINTINNNLEFDKLSSNELNNLFPICIGNNEIIKENSNIIKSVGEFSISNNSTNRVPDFFVVSTGRSGTKAISKLLNDHSEVSCEHEANFILNRLSTELAHGFKSEEEVFFELELIYKYITIDFDTNKLIGECDLKNSNLIFLINRLKQNIKFIWLIRRADNFVASAFGRRWFDEYEYTYPFPVKSFDTSNNYEIFDKYRMEYARYRVNGYLAKVFSKEEWKSMGCFERCCWYWNWWNLKIEEQLIVLDRNNYIKVQLEELENEQNVLFQFLSLNNHSNLDFVQVNKAYHDVVSKDKWNSSQLECYHKWCDELMNKWYHE